MSALPFAIGFTTIRHLRQSQFCLSSQLGLCQGVTVCALSVGGGFRQMLVEEAQERVRQALATVSLLGLSSQMYLQVHVCWRLFPWGLGPPPLLCHACFRGFRSLHGVGLLLGVSEKLPL